VDNVESWVEGAAGADDVFVLDTGSKDDTDLELQTYPSVTVRRANFKPFRFDDARNCALALAPEADLYLRLDADERLPADWRGQVESAYDPNIPRYSYYVHNHSGIWETIIRDDLHRRGGFRWKYPTHEVLVGPPAVLIPGLIVQHRSAQERRPHHLTNLDVLFTAVHEYPGDHRMYFYLAREFLYAGNWDACRDWMTQFLDLPNGWGPERSEAFRILASIDYEPERWLWKAVAECPARREPWVDLARHYLGVGNEADAALALGFAYDRNDDTIYTTDPQCWGEPFIELLKRVGAPA
jgi:glycosyltransferase involved in cell wall biosynthesis